MSNTQPVLQTFQLSKRFGELEAVQNVNLRLSPGEIVGLLGPNGAGKSTTIKMLSTLLRPSAGSAVLVGYDLIKDPFKIRQHIGIIFQDSTLDNRLTGRENLEFHCMIYKVPKQERPARIQQMLEMVDLTEAANRYVKTYSGGMKRRLEIARGLLHRPAILFLDEPTVGLDPQTRATIWEYVRRLVKEYGMGVLMTTHYMEEAENCRYIAIMDHGRLIAEGSPEHLKSMMEGDRIQLATADNSLAASWLEQNRSLKVTVKQDGIEFVLPHGDTQLARLLTELPTEVHRLTVQQPTLEDVFIKLTGRQMRDSESGLIDRLRFSAQRKGRL
ncbi:daunorubicin resistance protein DrrA family ABC transporter ATP-binding protein [Paradesulfitobacterium aromaticivorans]